MEKKLIIVGTAHVSQKSIEAVEKVIEEEKPDAVAVEICERRYKALVGEREDLNVWEILKKGEFFLILFQLILGYFQRKIGEKMKVRPGEEMLAAIQKAREIGADVIFIDRDVKITLKRLWGKMSLLEKLRFFYHMFRSFRNDEFEVEEMLKEDVIDLLVREFRKVSPRAAEVLIDERDAFMAYNLKKALQRYNKIVAVVGAGHKRGLEEWMQREVDVKDLLTVKERRILRIFLVFFAVLIIFFFAITAIVALELLYKVFLYWFLINGTLAATGAFLARAHPISILIAFLTAWFTSLNPFLASGWISGLVEAWIRKPVIKDVENLFKSESLKDLMNNRFFRVILVAALTNVGSTVGTVYGSYYIITNFGIDIVKSIPRIFGL
ncbi:MAG: TraB/GumN family protein [Archaeoglobaceae archaeon]|nr:TraB/GumN family protein [Archaeoglobaceae archaeon]